MTNDGFHTYTYDAEGKITAVDGGGTAQYVYNALNQRVQATVGGVATDYVFNAAGQRVSEWNGATRAQLKGKYYWGSRPVAFYANGATHFEHQDWLGTERMRTTYNGAVEGTFTSFPFGDGQVIAGADTDANHYATLDHDVETDTDYAQFRQYSNAQGRWLSPDPYSGSYQLRKPQSFNRYVYAGNNPLAAVDPSGLDENNLTCYTTGDGLYWCYGGNGETTLVGKDSSGNYFFIESYNSILVDGSNNSDPDLVSVDPGSVLANGGGIGGTGDGRGGRGAPNTGVLKPISRAACAAQVADDIYSIAAHTSGSSPYNPVVKAFLGNSVSGLVSLFTSDENPLPNLIEGGWNPGIPGVAAPEIGGVALDGGLTGVATRLVAAGATDTIGLVKLGYDAASFGYAYVHDCRQ